METSLTFNEFKKEWITNNNFWPKEWKNDSETYYELQGDGSVRGFMRLKDTWAWDGISINGFKKEPCWKHFTTHESIPLLGDAWNQCWKEFNKSDDTYKNWIYFTISPDKLLRGSLKMCDLPILREWCDEWFSKYHYDHFEFAIESGKQGDGDEHLHVHGIVKGVKTNLKKNGHYKVLIEHWNENMPIKLKTIGRAMFKNGVKIKKKSTDIEFQIINSKKLLEEKRGYLDNEKKGTHKNFTDLMKDEAEFCKDCMGYHKQDYDQCPKNNI